MRKIAPFLAILAGVAGPALAQNPDSITLYEYPAFFGRSVTITAATPDLAAQTFAQKARSARVVGSWTACREKNYAGTCATIAADQQQLFLIGMDKAITSLKPTNPAATATTGMGATTAPATGTAAVAGADKVDLSTLDVDAGAPGQDTEFYAQPALAKNQVSAGTSDKAAGEAFCKSAGYASSVHASRARVQASALIDMTSGARVRAFPLRDVLCKR